ncbi:MAG: 16S rRNA (guanine(966)-N(2))-methyltransferase RsmD [Planctomycetota bacterium]|jgi:16S rRNA (guanine(966)-N(2))-methyltransferase RsmD
MRIIAGQKRGMKLISPKADVSRPITDRVKESLFNVLRKYDLPTGKRVADLFSGVGSIGLEALSRGAEFVLFVEKNPKIIETLYKNIKKAGFAVESKVLRANAFKIGAPINFDKPLYDFVMIDPPFPLTVDVGKDSAFSKLMAILAEQLKPDGIIVIRTHKQISLLEQYGEFKMLECRQWGINAVSILQR